MGPNFYPTIGGGLKGTAPQFLGYFDPTIGGGLKGTAPQFLGYFDPTIGGGLKGTAPQFPGYFNPNIGGGLKAHAGLPVHPALLGSPHVLNGYFPGSDGAGNSYVLLLLLLALVMYLRFNFTRDGNDGGTTGGGNGNEKIPINPREGICGIPTGNNEWKVDSYTGTNVGDTAVYICKSRDGCDIILDSTCEGPRGWDALPPCDQCAGK